MGGAECSRRSAAPAPSNTATHITATLTSLDRGVMRRLSHTAPETVGAAIDRCARAMRRARLHFGHGTDNARDEAAELVFFAAGLGHELGAGAYSKPLTARRSALIDALLERRITERIPLAYLTHRSF